MANVIFVQVTPDAPEDYLDLLAARLDGKKLTTLGGPLGAMIRFECPASTPQEEALSTIQARQKLTALREDPLVETAETVVTNLTSS